MKKNQKEVQGRDESVKRDKKDWPPKDKMIRSDKKNTNLDVVKK